MNIPNKLLFFITYDGVDNSVFESQVIAPLLNKQKNDPKLVIQIISFEKNPSQYKSLKCPFAVTFLKKYPYVGKFSLLPALYQLKKVLQTHCNYQIVARGPIAGLLSFWATKKIDCNKLTIQSRGLLAQEYIYAQGSGNSIKKFIHRMRASLYKRLEASTYIFASNNNIHIEAVSTALKDYLIEAYQLRPEIISIAAHDIPAPISHAEKMQWRIAVRTELAIKFDAFVYCYNGSAKLWQCPDETVSFFVNEQVRNPQAFLLILTNEPEFFENICMRSKLTRTSYRILTVAHNEIYRYLAAADAGIIFREPHVINWTSRPTKALEYQALGLEIVHNNTVEMLINSK